MPGYALKKNEKKSAKVFGKGLPISTKDSVAICRKISGMNLQKGREFLIGMLSEERSLDGKFHTKATMEIVGLLNSAESNAEFKGLDPEKMIINASAHEGYTFYRPRRFKVHGRKKKITHVQIVLEQK